MSKPIGSTRDSKYISVTEVMGLAADAMDKSDTDTLLVITLSGPSETAIIGGEVNAQAVARVEALLGELKRRAVNEGDGDKVLHVWR